MDGMRKVLRHNNRDSEGTFGTPRASHAHTMNVQTILRYPKVAGTALAFLSLLVGVVALVAADFGAPGWMFVPLLLWLATLGLPTTIAVLLLAAVWGRAAPLHGFGLFCIVATVLAAGAEVLFVKCAGYLARGCHEN